MKARDGYAASFERLRFGFGVAGLVISVFTLLLLGVAGVASAATVQTHPHVGAWAPPASATPNGPFRPMALAVNQTTGNVYAADVENNAVHIFKDNGTFLGTLDGSAVGGFDFFAGCCWTKFIGLAIDRGDGPTSGRVYVSARTGAGGPAGGPEGIHVFAPDGSFLFTNPSPSANFDIDSNGALVVTSPPYSGSGDGGRIRWEVATFRDPQKGVPSERFYVEPDPFFRFAESIGEAAPIHLADLAVDSQNNLYGTAYLPNLLVAFNRDGSLRWQAASTPAINAVDVDRSSDAIYALEGIGGTNGAPSFPGFVSRYDTDGHLQETFGLSNLSDYALDIAVAEATGVVYVADPENHAIEVFGAFAPAPAPDATSGSATAVTDTAATLNGTVNPQGADTSWRFEYRRQKTRTWTPTPLQDAGAGSSEVEVTTSVSGLSQNTTYEFRLRVANSQSGAMSSSAPATFTTSGAAQAVVSINPVSSLTPTGGHLSGSVDPNGSDAKWHFEYTTDNSFEDNWSKVGEDQTVSAGSGAVPVSADVAGLRPNTHYFARLVATNETGGPKQSNEVEFTTPPAPPIVFTLAAGCLTPSAACLGGYLDAKNSQTTYYFEYGTDNTYGSAVPVGHDGDGGSAFGSTLVRERISGLQSDTTYHYRLVAENPAGTTHGPDMIFETRPDAAAVAELEASWPARGFELVNLPDKGNQSAFPVAKEEPWTSITPDGNRVWWKIINGGPGTPTGATNIYLATPTATGWTSRSSLPPVSKLPGGGDAYFEEPATFTPDFSSAYYLSARGGLYGKYRRHFIRVDEQEDVTVLDIRDEVDNNSIQATVAAASDGRLVIGGGSAGHVGKFPLTRYEADGTPISVAVPACGYLFGAEDPAETWVNADASRVFVYSAGNDNCSAPRGIYMIAPETGAITRVSGAQTVDARFIRANEAGTALLFSKGGDLYRWSEAGGEECLSCGSGLTITTGTASTDLSHLYFCGPPPAAFPAPKEGNCAIYVWRERGISFVANRSEVKGYGFDPDNSIPIQIDASGDHMIFRTTKPFFATADETGWNGDGGGGGAVATQLYRYDDDTGVVECISCTDPASGGLAPSEIFVVSNRSAISADGHTVAFSTNSKLVPADINGRYDVYEWHDGLVRLVTDGESEFEPSLGGMPRAWGLSADGRNLFFSQGGVKLTGDELDGFSNVYNGRVGGAGFPLPLPPAHCVEESCQGPLAVPPPLSGIGSSTFSGPGNLAAKKKHGKKKHRRKKAKGKHRHKQKRNGQQGKRSGKVRSNDQKRGGAK